MYQNDVGVILNEATRSEESKKLIVDNEGLRVCASFNYSLLTLNYYGFLASLGMTETYSELLCSVI